MGRRVQARGGSLHTSRTGAVARVRSRYGLLPQRTIAVAHVPKNSGVTITCSRSADAGGERADVQGVGSSFHSLPQAQKLRRTRYRGVIVAAALNGCHRDDRRCERGRGQLCEAGCRTHRRLHQHGSRHHCRPDRGQRRGCRCAAKPRPATLGCMARMLGGSHCRRSRLARRWRVAPSRARVQLLSTLTKTARAPPARSVAAKADERAHRWPIRMPAVDHTGLLALRSVVRTQKAAGAVRHRPLFVSRAPISSA